MKPNHIYASLLALLLTTGCIKNDVPYPIIECAIDSIAADGLAGAPAYDRINRTVTLPLDETTDIQAVNITYASTTNDALMSKPIVGVQNLSQPLVVNLTLYQNYEWRIEATQTITREFRVENQIGATEWDMENKTARVKVSTEDLGNITIKTLKLGPAGITRMVWQSTELNDANLYVLHDFRDGDRLIDVTCHNRTETWWLHVEHTDAKVAFTQIDGWSKTAWLYASGESGSAMGFSYRASGSDTWIEVPADDIEIDGGAFQTRLRGLNPESVYEVIAYSGSDTTAVEKFMTERTLPLPNAGFEDWATLSGGILRPYLSPDEAFWDTGNRGSQTIGAIISQSSPDIRPGSSGHLSAELHSQFVVVKFAAGNIFIGTYAETVLTNGKVNFGRPFTARPTALHGWIKYTQGTIDRIGTQPQGMTLQKGDNDQGSIYIAVGTWTPEEYGGTAESPVQIYTADVKTFFNSKAPAVIGYGEWMIDESINEWQEFTIPIEYRRTDEKPTHLIIVCSASRWGDYFTGSSQSRMWLDDFELLWD